MLVLLTRSRPQHAMLPSTWSPQAKCVPSDISLQPTPGLSDTTSVGCDSIVPRPSPSSPLTPNPQHHIEWSALRPHAKKLDAATSIQSYAEPTCAGRACGMLLPSPSSPAELPPQQ